MSQDKTPQTINDLVSEIGERMVLFKLYTLINERPDLEIFKNYSEPGFDIGIRSSANADKVEIEVKTRQHIVTTTAEKSKNSCHFTVTENERKHANFLIGYWIDYNDFFIVPVARLKKVGTKKPVYKLVLSRLKNPKNQQIYSESAMEFLNNWQEILFFADNKPKNNNGKTS